MGQNENNSRNLSKNKSVIQNPINNQKNIGMISTQNNVDETISRQNKKEIFQNNNKIKLYDIEKNKMTIYLKSNREDLVFSTSVLNKNSLKPVLKSENRYQMLRNGSNIESAKFSNNNTTRKDASPIPSRLPVI